MRRIRFSVAMSLDGYIAGPNGESDWIVMDPEIDFRALMGSFDTILLGRKTYEVTRHQGGGGMPGMRGRPSRRPRAKTSGSLAAASSSAACSSSGWWMRSRSP